MTAILAGQPHTSTDSGLTGEPPDVIFVPMLTISDAIDLFDGHLAQRGRTDRTRDSYLRTLGKFEDRFPRHWDVTKVTADDCASFLAQWARRSLGTQAQVYAPLNGLFKYLYRTGRVKTNPMEFIDPPVRQRPEDLDVVTISTVDVDRLLAATQNWSERLAIAIPAYLGPRRQAIARLRLSDYDYDRQLLRFREKGGKTIWKPVPPELAQMIEAADLAGAFVPPDFYLVPPQGDLRRKGDRDDRVVWRLVKKVADRVGIKTHVHALRAEFACYYLENHPGDSEALQELLGHESAETTRVYLRKFNRAQAMERVRSLSRGATLLPEIPANSDSSVRSLGLMGAGGFEPPSADSPAAMRRGTKRGAD